MYEGNGVLQDGIMGYQDHPPELYPNFLLANTEPPMPMILLLDNYDSFVYNLDRYLQQLGQQTLVLRSDVPSRSMRYFGWGARQSSFRLDQNARSSWLLLGIDPRAATRCRF